LGKATFTDIGITGKINSGLLTINGLDDSTATPAATINTLSGPLKLQSLAINGIDMFNGKVTIDTEGNMNTAGEITAKKYNIDTKDSAAASLGEGILPLGKTKVEIKTTAVTNDSKIFVTAEDVITKPLNVTGKLKGKSFTVETDTALQKDVKFNWWIVN